MLTDAEVRALIAACGRGTPTAARNAALVALLYRSGLRVGEALALRPKDVDVPGGQVRVLGAKGGRWRVVGLDPGAGAYLAAWMAQRAAWRPRPGSGVRPRPGAGAPVFCLRDGGPMTPGYARVLLPRLARRAGLEKRVHAHGLRHTHAAQLRAEGVDVGIISRQLGHASMLTTIRYLDHIAPVDVIRAISARDWPQS